jgi:hypothetical protein
MRIAAVTSDCDGGCCVAATRVECTYGRTELLTAAMLATAGARPEAKVPLLIIRFPLTIALL